MFVNVHQHAKTSNPVGPPKKVTDSYVFQGNCSKKPTSNDVFNITKVPTTLTVHHVSPSHSTCAQCVHYLLEERADVEQRNKSGIDKRYGFLGRRPMMHDEVEDLIYLFTKKHDSEIELT